jgi:glycosyltransferase involved in cell wall biosynthesis
MSANCPISVCVCTYCRPEGLRKCLESILEQENAGPFEVVVVDDDLRGSAAAGVAAMRTAFSERQVPLIYVADPRRNIALARNAAVGAARGELIAFIDDDEQAEPRWLGRLREALETYGADVVVGAVVPSFPDDIPAWLRGSGAFYRKCAPTGTRLRASDCRTGNVLARRAVFNRFPFEARLGRIGNSDSLVFRQAERAGWMLCACAEARVFETQESDRRRWRWHMRREYRCGWGDSYIRRKETSLARTLGGAVLSVLPGWAMAMARAIARLSDLRVAGLVLLRGLAFYAGRIGFFVFPAVEEYKERR